MKVSLVAPQDISIVVGGLRTQVLETARYLPTFDIEVDFFNPWEVYEPHSVDLFHLFAANAATYQLATSLADYGLPFVLSPVMYSNHNPRFIQMSRKLEQWSKKLVSGIWTDYAVIERLCNMSHKILPNTGAEAAMVTEGFNIDPQKIQTVPNGVEKRFMTATSKAFVEQYGLDDFVLFVGNIGSKRKNVFRLVQALSDLNHTVVFIGKTLNNAYGRKCIAAIEKHPHMHLLDPIPHNSPLLASAYAASRVLVLPSYYETPGISAMEAALTGSAVAITERGGPREYFKDYAHYLQPESISSIKQAVVAALEEPAGEELKEHIRSHYLWPHIAQQTAAIYKQIKQDGF